MRITILAIGKLKESYWKEALAEYLRRLSTHAKVEVVELPDRDKQEARAECAQTREGVDILKRLSSLSGGNNYIIALDGKGKQLSSEEISAKIDDLKLSGKSQLAFVIGGSNGLSLQALSAANEALSFGKQTWPHQLARVMLAEQLYRAFTISAGHPYHK